MNAIHKNRLAPLSIEDGEIDRARFALVYQAGIANLFRVHCFNLSPDGRDAKRVYQGDFRTAASMAIGAGFAGAIVMSFSCNMAGDIAEQKWTDDLESAPFSDSFLPVFFTIGL